MINWNYTIIVLLFSAWICPGYSENYSGFLRVKGKQIVDQDETNVLLKGINLGNWLVNEPYMMQFPGELMPIEPIMRKEILEVLNGDQSLLDRFYEVFHQNYVQPIDIQHISECGFNSIRLPLDAEKLGTYNAENGIYTIKEKGYAQIDSVLSWARPYNLYVILDMHRMPGGSSAAVDHFDGNYDHPDAIFNNQVLQDHYVAAWESLAIRYKDDFLVGGYDLMNEPNWDFKDNNQNKPLLNLYKRVTAAIRKHDTGHIIFIEGNGYSWDFRGLKLPWDNNMVYAFHKYLNWQVGDYDVNEMIALRDGANRPVWNGETGENSNLWLTNMAKRYEAVNIGWSVWPHKKIGSIVGPLTIPYSEKYRKLIQYWAYKEDNSRPYYPRPSAAEAFDALMEQADLCRFEKCKFQKDYVDALIRQPQSDETFAWKEILLPDIKGRTVRINASEFDLGSVGNAYQTSQRDWNNAYSFRNDEINVLAETGEANGFVVGNIHSDNSIGKEEWTKYSIQVPVAGLYEVKIRYRAWSDQTNPGIRIQVDDTWVDQAPYLLKVNGKYATELIGQIPLTEQTSALYLHYLGSDFRVSTIDFKLIDISNSLSPMQLYPQEKLQVVIFDKEIYGLRNAREEAASITVFDLMGKQVFSENVASAVQVHIPARLLPDGILVVQVSYPDGGTQYAKVHKI